MPSDLLTRGFAATDAELAVAVGTPQPPQYRVFLRDPNYGIRDELDNWTHLEFVKRGNAIGSFSLEIANDTRTPSAVELQKAWGIVIKRDGVTVFSGSVTRFSKTFRTISVSGECDNALLRALAHSDPFTFPPNPNPPAYQVNTSQASDVLLALVNNNIGPAARPDRKVAALYLAPDPHIGSTITARAGFQPLIALMSELAITPLATGLAFGIQQSDTVANALEFKVWAPVDRSADAKFSIEAGTAQDYQDTQQAPAANAPFVMLGDGLTGQRTILEDTDAFSVAEWGRRWETVIDRRDVSDPGEGNQALAEAMAQTSTSRQVTITPIDVPSLQWGRDYDLLDLATFATGGAGGGTFVDLVREIHFSWDAERGPVVTPLLGQTGATNDDLLSTMVSTIQGRLSNVERNWRVPDDSITDDMLHPFVKWAVGDLRLTARPAAQAGWLLCQGQAVSRATYALLYAAIGTTFGAGDGSTTFNVPDLRGRFPLGAGGSYALGSSGGSTSAAGLPHTHPHSHGGGTLSWAHTHPGSHSHGIGSHTHTIVHNHLVDLDHDHASFSSGGVNVDTVAVGTASLGSGTSDHHHSVNVPALGSTMVATGGASGGAVSGASGGTTDPDSNAFAVGAGATWSGGTDSDSSAASYSGSVSTLNPYTAITYEIFAGVS